MMGLLLWSVFLSTIGTISTIEEFNAAVGGIAVLYGSSLVSPNQRIDWNLDDVGNIIATRLPGQNSTYGGRCLGGKCILNEKGFLRMDQILSADNRSYTLTLQAAGVQIKELVQLNVYNSLTPPSLNLSSTIRPVNGTSLNLMCNAGNQTVHSIYFYRNEVLLACSSPHLSCDKSNPYLTFNPILASDSGNYTCGIENPISRNMSSSIILDVSVIVSGVTLRSNTTQPVIAEKEAVSLICSSYGTEVNYNWTLMGSPLPLNPRYRLTNNNSTLVISPVWRSDQGAFTCLVFNYLNSEISNPLNLTWSPSGHIECGAERLDQSIQFYCLWPGGYPPADVHLIYDNFRHSGLDRATTTVLSNQLSLGAQLNCRGSHFGSSEMCSLVIDTPQSAGFINDTVKTINSGSSATLSVTLTSDEAAKIFPAKFSWFLLNPDPFELFSKENISIISNDYSSFLIISSMSKEFNGQYMCKAENAMGSKTFTFIVNVNEEETLSIGAIAGIVIGSLGVVALIAIGLFLIFLMYKKNNNKREIQSHSRQKPDNTESCSSENSYSLHMPTAARRPAH